jgi:hypothetical protein
VDTDTALTRREATLRSAATTCLAGLALIQAIELPPLFAQGKQLAVLAIAATALCIVLGWSLAAASAGAARQVWRVVAGTGVLVVAGWAAQHAFSIPGLASDRGNWDSLPGLASATLGLLCVGLAVAAVPPTRAMVRSLATALAVTLALTPVVAIVLVGLGPGTSGGENVLASGAHIHSHGSPENAIIFQPLPGGGGRYVYKTTVPPHHSPVGIGLMVAAAFMYAYGAVAYLRRRSAPAESSGLAGLDLEGGLQS